MLRQLLTGAALWGALGSATTATTYSVTTVTTCATAFGSGGVPPLSLPTDLSRATTTSATTSAEVTVPSTVRVTAAPVTTTVRTSTVWFWDATTTTLPVTTSWVRVYATVDTATVPVTVCTAGSTPETTTTVYTGAYTPVPGQDPWPPASYPTRAACTARVTTWLLLAPTATSGTTTVTETPTSTEVAVTATVSATYYFSGTTYAATETQTTTSFVVGLASATVSASCAPTATATLAARCAPGNVISGVGGRGLVSGRYAENITVIYVGDARFEDPSRCCQLCQDNAGCAAIMAGISGFCGLYYQAAPAGGPACGAFSFTYQSQANYFPGQGLWIQEGCGRVEFTGPVGGGQK
ncbi:hypothetical protein GGS23DRAFT_608462 [Durotheca rogersii]|uniref:uncharacterized protein n=1 Tax=Durotheca rogersii TaxID=419775 RepID=UPI00221F8FE8|nr:uncharacterized protein GGS23DRAFT_608462 [Durotheca rogersii]KAI5867912.1 hypothetical protein GGS23DRAFT_608462 [Durotheca rogersii]